MAPNVGVWVRACTCMCLRACVCFYERVAWVFVYVFGGCVVSAYAFMSVVGARVLPCVRAYVNFVSTNFS